MILLYVNTFVTAGSNGSIYPSIGLFSQVHYYAYLELAALCCVSKDSHCSFYSLPHMSTVEIRVCLSLHP